MKALTIWRPWPWAICHSSPRAKRTENRTWLAEWMRGRELAIHAGSKVDDADAHEMIADILGVWPPKDTPTGIVAVATVAGFREHRDFFAAEDDPWLVGPIGWRLDNVRVLREPVQVGRCRRIVRPPSVQCGGAGLLNTLCPRCGFPLTTGGGAQGLWDLPVDVERAVLKRLPGAVVVASGARA